jgi:GMP synthase (glutamine-hydrolysing)
VLVLQHEADTPPGTLATVLREHGYAVQTVDARDTDLGTVDPLAADLFLILGSELGVYETDEHPSILAEIALVRSRLLARRPTLGICFGAQLMAAAFGARVYRGESKQIGFRTVALTEAGLASPLRHFDGVEVLQWHGDTFDLPAHSAVRLATSSSYLNEAYAVDDWALAVQFHPEVTAKEHEDWMHADRASVAALGLDPEALRVERAALLSPMTAAAHAAFGEWLDALP